MDDRIDISDLSHFDSMLKAYREMQTFNVVAGAILATYPEETFATGLFDDESILSTYNASAADCVQISKQDVQAVVFNDEIKKVALKNIHRSILYNAVLHMTNEAQTLFIQRKRFGVVKETSLWKLLQFVRDTFAHERIDLRKIHADRGGFFDDNGSLEWGGIKITKACILVDEQSLWQSINEAGVWTILYGLEDLCMCASFGASDAILKLCGNVKGKRLNLIKFLKRKMTSSGQCG